MTNQTYDSEFHEEFWCNFAKYLTEFRSSLKPHDKSSLKGLDEENPNTIVYISNNNLELVAQIWPKSGRMAAKIILDEEIHRSYFKDHKTIEKKFSDRSKLKWHKSPLYSVGVYECDIDFSDVPKHEKLFEWLHRKLDKLENTFARR